jgi:hypothetical protein
MGNPTLAPIEAAKSKADLSRLPSAQRSGPSPLSSLAHLLGAAGNMAIQRAASGPLAHNPAAPAIIGGASMSGGGCSCGGTCEECKKKQVQRKGEGGVHGVPSAFEGALARSGAGMPLAPHTRGIMENRFGDRFDDVRVHADSSAAEAAHHVSAHAFTMGRDVYFGAGRYDPHSTGGQKLIAHELTHVLQQRRGAVTPGLKSLNATAHDDAFEREAELVESAFEKADHRAPSPQRSTIPSRVPATVRESHRVQRKCACGGTCSECSKKQPETQLGEVQKHPLQRKVDGFRKSSLTSTAEAEQAERLSAQNSIQRKCECGGSCPKCSGLDTPASQEAIKSPLQRKPEKSPIADESAVPPDQAIQRKCGCGAPERKPDEETKKVVQRKAEPQAAPAQNKVNPPSAVKNENAAGRDLRGLPETNAPHRLGPKAPRKPGTHLGGPRRPGTAGRPAPGNLQRSGAGSLPVAHHNDHYEREAEAASAEVARGGMVSSEKFSKLDQPGIQPFSWEFCNPFSDPDCGLSSTASVVKSEAEELADKVRDAAEELADAIGGILEYIDNLLVITIPPMHLCDAHTLQTTLPEVGIDIPFLAGVLPLGIVEIYGELGAHLGFTPELSFLIGPCETHEIKIEIHPISLAAKARGGLELTVGLGLGAELHAGIFGEVGAVVMWPDPPIVAKIPAVHLEAGLAGFIRLAAADHFSIDISAGASLSGFSFSLDAKNDLGLASDLGLAGYGSLSVLGMNLCTLYWPLFKDHRDFVLSLGLGVGLDVGEDGAPSLGIDPDAPSFDNLDWDDLGFKIQRDMFKDNCPLCDFLYGHGLMPSQRGGEWKGTPSWPHGPLHVFRRDPAIKSKALCRGACGPDCDTCRREDPHRECEEAGDGSHFWWVYPQYEVCGTHDGCRQHDACYDWCADKYNEVGKLGIILGPCHRLCDFECICNYHTPQCVGWIRGGKPHDGQMIFSDEPQKKPGCTGPCPTRKGGKAGEESWLLCLPTLELFPRQDAKAKHLHEETGKFTIWEKHVLIPYVGLVSLEIYAGGKLDGDLSAGLGPGTLSNICFDFDPHTGAYKARGELRIPADFLAALSATAELNADAKWFLVVKVASAKGTLNATAELAGKATLILSGQIDLSCKGGKPTLESDLDFPRSLALQFDLNAGFDVEALGFNVFSRKWKLAHARWDKAWGEDLKVGHTGGPPKFDLRDETISLTDLLKWLLSDEAEKTEPPDQQRQVKERPLKTTTAKTIPELAPQLNQVNRDTTTLTIGGASSDAGTSMMARFLTSDHGRGTETNGPQKNLLGFRKLPTLAAFGGKGHKQTQVYIRGHLLNAGLSGRGEANNLFPITGQANKDHNTQVEETVKDLVNTQGLVTMYGVRVTDQDPPTRIDVQGDGTCIYEFLNSTFACTYGTYTLYTDNTVELTSAINTPIRSAFDTNGFIAGVSAKNCPEKNK